MDLSDLEDLGGGWKRRTLLYALALVVVVFGYTVVYHAGMWLLEGEQVTVLHSLQVVVETFTTTGFGSDAPWTNPWMNVLVIAMDVTGVALIFLALPLLLLPLFAEATSRAPPRRVDLEDHVVICGFTGRGEAFVEELDAWDADHVIVEPDADRAIELDEAGWTVVHGDPESREAHERACTARARAVVADAGDEANASVALTVRELDPEVEVVAFVEDPDHAEYVRYAGAGTVLRPRRLLGASLAETVIAFGSPDIEDVVEVGEDIEVAELPVQAGSDLEGRRLADSGIRERTGANVIGVWREGVLEGPPAPDDVLEVGTSLLAVGRADGIERLKALTSSEARGGRGRVVVLGHGEVGRAVTGALAAAGVDYTVVDREDASGVDVVGDARDEASLEEAGLPGARAAILALPDDTTTIFATLVARELAPDVQIVVRAADPDNVRKLYLAGADYVLSLSTVSGRMLADTVLDEDVIAPDMQVEVIRCEAPALVGRTLGAAAVRSRTGATVIAIQRDGGLVTDPDADTVVEAGDELVVAGDDEAINRFTALSH